MIALSPATTLETPPVVLIVTSPADPLTEIPVPAVMPVTPVLVTTILPVAPLNDIPVPFDKPVTPVLVIVKEPPKAALADDTSSPFPPETKPNNPCAIFTMALFVLP